MTVNIKIIYQSDLLLLFFYYFPLSVQQIKNRIKQNTAANKIAVKMTGSDISSSIIVNVFMSFLIFICGTSSSFHNPSKNFIIS